MEQMRGPSGLGKGTKTNHLIYDEFQPSSDWTRDSNSHVLLLDLPGFKRQELEVQVESFRKLAVSGARQVNEKKYSRFKQVFDLPEDSDIDKINAKFEGRLLFIVVPKKVTERMEEQPKKDNVIVNESKEKSNNEGNIKKGINDKHDHGRDTCGECKRNCTKEGLDGGKLEKEDWRKEELEVLMKSAMEKINNNKAAIISVVLAFSIGFYLSHKFRKG